MVHENKKKSGGESVAKKIKRKDGLLEKQFLNSIKKLEIFFDEVLDNHKRKILANFSVLKNIPDLNSYRDKEKIREFIIKIDLIKIKPKKGRAKDLEKIEKILKEAVSLFPEET